MNLYLFLLGATLPNRFIEQHDVFFGIGNELQDLVPHILEFWNDDGGHIHIDAYRKVTIVDSYRIKVVDKSKTSIPEKKLYFLNLGGYKENDFEEHHYKQLVVAKDIEEAILIGKRTVFWKHHKSAHLDDKYGIDVDDIYEIADLLSTKFKSMYSIEIENLEELTPEDELQIGYIKLT